LRSGGPPSLRSQLILGSMGVIGVTFTGLALLLAAFFGQYFRAGRANSLRVRAQEVARLLQQPPASANPRIATLVADTGGHLWLLAADGRTVRQLGAAGFGGYAGWASPSMLPDALAGRSETRFLTSGDRRPAPFAVVAVPVPRVYGQPVRDRFALIWAAGIGGADVLRAVAARVAAVAALGLILAAALFAWLSARVAAPIRRLEQAAGRIAGGTFDVELVNAGPAEVRSLARSLREMADRLRDLDASRRAFLADVSHELRSPLAALRGALAGVQAGGTSAGERAHALDLAIGETERLGRLVDDLLVLARADAARLDLHRQTVDLREAALRVALSLEPVATARGVAFRFDGDGTPAPVDADPDRLSQVLWNLLDNAARHTPAGGEAHVTIGHHHGGIRLRVSNPGDRIPPEAIGRLFERFQRGNGDRDGGTGLGLAIARTLVEAHGGTITAEAPDQGGLTVTVCWPTAAAT
jgi:two-component system sensor histidine kinase BaeS